MHFGGGVDPLILRPHAYLYAHTFFSYLFSFASLECFQKTHRIMYKPISSSNLPPAVPLSFFPFQALLGPDHAGPTSSLNFTISPRAAYEGKQIETSTGRQQKLTQAGLPNW